MATNRLRDLLFMPSSTNALAGKTLMPVTPTTPKGDMELMPVTPTTLEPELENLYKGWVLKHKIPESNDYDMRGYFLGMLLGNKKTKAEANPALYNENNSYKRNTYNNNLDVEFPQ
jgi:hypothetical protein